eukprot:scaffold11077_cov78-Cyclotella_meneghiniana.AAC.9
MLAVAISFDDEDAQFLHQRKVEGKNKTMVDDLKGKSHKGDWGAQGIKSQSQRHRGSRVSWAQSAASRSTTSRSKDVCPSKETQGWKKISKELDRGGFAGCRE